LVHSQTEKIFILSCDVPLMAKEMIEYIVKYKSEKPVVFCEAAGHHQPLVGVYSKSIIKQVEEFLRNDNTTDKLFHQFLKNVNAEIIHPEGLSYYKDEIFFNVNKLEDYDLILKKFYSDDM
ncbi:MAG: molybdenum cofactor guanylyltransferase, partial [Ignavibacteria bacterium]